MKQVVIGFLVAGVVAAVLTYLLDSPRAVAMTVAVVPETAIPESDMTQKVRYVCRQTSNGTKCYNVSSSDRPRDYQQNGNGSNPYFQNRYSPSQYQSHPWGSPYGEH